MKRARYKVGVLGTCAGGTSWATALLRGAGLDVGHENLQKSGHWFRDGIVCGQWVWKGRYYSRNAEYGWDNVSFDHVIRLARHPLLCSETLHAHTNPGGPWRHQDKQLRALRYWVLTHQEIDKWAPGLLLRVEGGRPHDEDWAPIASALELGEERPVEPPKNRMSGGRLPRLTWPQWRARDPEYAALGADLVRRLRLVEPRGA